MCHHSGKICDLLPQEKGNQWRTNTIVNTTHVYVYLSSLLYFNSLHIIWHLTCLYSFGIFVSAVFTINLYCLLHFCLLFTSLAFGNVDICFPCQWSPWIELNRIEREDREGVRWARDGREPRSTQPRPGTLSCHCGKLWKLHSSDYQETIDAVSVTPLLTSAAWAEICPIWRCITATRDDSETLSIFLSTSCSPSPYLWMNECLAFIVKWWCLMGGSISLF